MRAVVVGAAGFVGGELLRILLQHPAVETVAATSRSRAGQPIAEAHPTLAAVTGERFLDLDPEAAAAGADVVFLALEHGESARLAPALFAAGPGLVVDLAADFRVADPALRERHYGPHPAPGLQAEFRYALADVEGAALRGARALAAPGCFATAAALALWPLAGLDLAAPPVLFAVTGSSGGGAKLRATAHHPTRAHNLFAYEVFSHRHGAEVAERWAAWTGDGAAPPRLTVHAGPFVRGIHLTLHARVRDGADAAARYAEAYQGRPFVHVLASPPELTHVVGTNVAAIHAASSGDEVLAMIAIDNLVKGAAGQAVQAMNLALGLPEDAGLRMAGAFPC